MQETKKHEHLTPTSPVPLHEPGEVPFVRGYGAKIKEAEFALEMGVMMGVERYDTEIPDYWREPEVSQAVNEGRADDLVGHLVLDGHSAQGRLALKKTPENIVNLKLGDQRPGVKRTRGPNKAISKETNRNFVQAVIDGCPAPADIAGRLVFITLSPGMKFSKKHIVEKMMPLVRKFWRDLVAEMEKKGVKIGVGFKMAFSKKATRPHFHGVLFLPLNRSVEFCTLLAAQIRARFDKIWRQVNVYGLHQEAWKPKMTAEAVRNALRYLERHETNPNITSSWGQPTFAYGTLPKEDAEVFNMSPQQFKTFWAACNVLQGMRKEHPWKSSFDLRGIDPRTLLLILAAIGVPISDAQWERFRVGW